MHITYLGILLLLINLLCFFNLEFLYVQTIFLMPFTAASVLNVNLAAHSIGIQPVFLTGTLWILIYTFKNMFCIKRKVITKQMQYFIIFAFLFLFVCFMSIIKHNLLYPNYRFVINASSVYWSPFTQMAYLLFGLVLTLFIAIYNNTLKRIEFTFKIVIISGCFVSVWGIMQFIFYYLKIQYPYFIFNNSASHYAAGYLQMLTNTNIKRVSSVAVEPSIFGLFLIIPVCIIMVKRFFKIVTFNYYIDLMIIILFLITIILTSSASAILSTIFLFVFLSFYVSVWKKNSLIILRNLTMLGVSIFLISIIFPALRRLGNLYVLHKLSTGSGLSRMGSIFKSFFIFLHNPLLGFGWGGVRCDDLIVMLLSSSGILGLFYFLIFFSYLFIKTHVLSLYLSRINYNKIFIICATSLLLLITTLFYNQISGFSFVFPMFWFVVGISLSVLGVAENYKNDTIKIEKK